VVGGAGGEHVQGGHGPRGIRLVHGAAAGDLAIERTAHQAAHQGEVRLAIERVEHGAVMGGRRCPHLDAEGVVVAQGGGAVRVEGGEVRQRRTRDGADAGRVGQVLLAVPASLWAGAGSDHLS
jgi:hypothetical protein